MMSDHTAPLDLSAIAIARNEERNLPGLIDNLRGLVRELVLVDDGSTDGTRTIAEAAAPFVRYIARPMDPEEGFAGQRNAGLAQATGTWVIHMDCDERFGPELAEDLRRILPSSSLNAYRYQRLNYFLNRPVRHGGWDSWNRPQICRRGTHRVVGRAARSLRDRRRGGHDRTGLRPDASPQRFRLRTAACQERPVHRDGHRPAGGRGPPRPPARPGGRGPLPCSCANTQHSAVASMVFRA